MAASAAAAAAAAAGGGGLLHLRTSNQHLPPPALPARPRPAASSARRSPRRQARTRSRSVGRRVPLLATPCVAAAAEEQAYTEAEEALLEALVGVQGRGRAVAPRQLQEVESAVQALEALEGVRNPRTFVGVDSFRIFQEVYLRTDDPRVVNVVKFSESVGELKVEAEAIIKDGKRILFRFDRAAFTFKFLPFKVPYPVPFRLLGDEAKGWLDTTYLSHTGNVRISRGNKGTTFVLQKSADPRQMLLSAISAGTGVKKVMDDLSSTNEGVEVELKTLVGEWQVLWTSQTEDEGWSYVAFSGLKGLQMIKEDGQLKNSVNLFPGASLKAKGSICKKGNSNFFSISMDKGAVQVGGLEFPLDMRREFVLEILYIDNKIRISKLNQHKIVHLRIANRT